MDEWPAGVFALAEPATLPPDEERPPEPKDGEFYHVEGLLAICCRRDPTIGHAVVRRAYYLVRWLGHGPATDSWEPADNLRCAALVAEFHRRRRAAFPTRGRL